MLSFHLLASQAITVVLMMDQKTSILKIPVEYNKDMTVAITSPQIRP